MIRGYQAAILLIEFDGDKTFALTGPSEVAVDLDSRSPQARLVLLLLHFPKLRYDLCLGLHTVVLRSTRSQRAHTLVSLKDHLAQKAPDCMYLFAAVPNTLAALVRCAVTLQCDLTAGCSGRAARTQRVSCSSHSSATKMSQMPQQQP
jgi:hypothetical protein